MPSSKSRKHSSGTIKVQQTVLYTLLNILGSNDEFCSAAANLSVNRTSTLNQMIDTIAVAGNITLVTKNSLSLVLSTFGNIPSPSPHVIRLQTQFSSFKTLHSQHNIRQRVAARLGLTSVDRLSSIPIHWLTKLASGKEYPPRNHYILERSDLPIPCEPSLQDRTCGQCINFHILNTDSLIFTLLPHEAAIFVDHQSDDIIAIVIRDFAQSYYSSIQSWGVNLITESINRRSLSQRNGPGQLARVGVSEGSRHAQLFGWVRNLKSKYRQAADRYTHEQEISSLFGLFYSLLRS